MSETQSKLITGAWAKELSTFLSLTQQELLIASPWITEGVAKFISDALSSLQPITLQILARMDAYDFMKGTSHINSFRKNTYPGQHNVIFRALPMLHGKMLVSDRQRVILGSANLTDGGLYRNHELSLHFDSKALGDACAHEFFRLWSIASEVSNDYLDAIEHALEDALPDATEETEPSSKVKKPILTERFLRVQYVRPPKAVSAQRLIKKALVLLPPPPVPHETKDVALNWLEQKLRFMSPEKRRAPNVVEHLERLMYHPDVGIRATAIDRAGRSINRHFLPRLQALATNAYEPQAVRSAATFALSLLGSAESFPTLSTIIFEKGDAGRWARRGCILLLNDIDGDNALWLLRELAVEDPTTILELARNCNIGQGTISERLTKALLIEQFARGHWTDDDVNQLVSIMTLTASVIVTQSRKINILAIVKYAAEGLEVAPGDLRHGPLSINLITRAAKFGITDPGLVQLIGENWRNLYNSPDSARDILGAKGTIGKVLQLISEE